MLADVLDPYTLRMVLLPVLAGLAICAYLVVRFVSQLAVKVVLVGFLVLVGVGVSHQRAGLTECARTNQCTVFGWSIDVPGR